MLDTSPVFTGSLPDTNTMGTDFKWRANSTGSPARHDDRHILTEELVSEGPNSLKIALGPAVVDANVLVFKKAGLAQTLSKRRNHRLKTFGSLRIKETDGWGRLLRARR